VLITAEAIIAGFLIAYGAVNGQMLTYWSNRPNGSPTTTYIAGIVLDAIVLTSFLSIVLLFNSLHTTNTNDTKNLLGRYNAGYDLFLWAILGSMAWVVTNGYSIYQYTVTNQTIRCFDNSTFQAIGQVVTLHDSLFYVFVVYAAALSVLVLLLMVPKLDCKVLRHFFARDDHPLFIDLLCFWILIAVIVGSLFGSTVWKSCIEGRTFPNTTLEVMFFLSITFVLVAAHIASFFIRKIREEKKTLRPQSIRVILTGLRPHEHQTQNEPNQPLGFRAFGPTNCRELNYSRITSEIKSRDSMNRAFPNSEKRLFEGLDSALKGDESLRSRHQSPALGGCSDSLRPPILSQEVPEFAHEERKGGTGKYHTQGEWGIVKWSPPYVIEKEHPCERH
jgi:small-conductance mechanosensitive channel